MWIEKGQFVAQDEKKFDQGETREEEGMGHADLKYGESVAFIQHVDSGLWLSYVTFGTKKRGVGRVEEKKVGNHLLLDGALCGVLHLARMW